MKNLKDCTITEINQELNERGFMGSLWCTEDIEYQAREDNTAITDKEACDVLLLLEKNHDTTMGITWDTISIVTNHIINNRK